ncbi:TIGR02996 domain-containing protein [Myxococcus xanthus]|uniref:TIGR02996 domain-containing protein n=1 Tax=Myxococcus xanthus TaxID=34 RepID=UPI001917709C|nr:TIGR02996 domain-containing protein [Myxococcus xanthus]QQR45265.1 TIGR02996 domain-containing protein [Myxococcus xanthus]
MPENSLHGLLEQALAAFEQRDEEEALRSLLEAWRESRSELIVTLVNALSDRLIAGVPPLSCRPFAPEMQAHRPSDLPRMLAGFEETASAGLVDPLCRQMEAFLNWPADPRLTFALESMTRMNISANRKVLDQLAALFMYLRDPRSLESLRRLSKRRGMADRHVQQFAGIIDLITRQEVSPVDAEALALCAALEEARISRAKSEARSAPIREALLARVYSHPDDDDARLVLADHLLEQGDARGEFIMLQCASQPDKARIRELLGKYSEAWQVPLGPLVAPEDTRFERGFPVAVRMNVERRSELLYPLLPLPGPAWGTVREIDWKWSGPPEAAAWLAHPHVHALHHLRRTRAAIARRLGAHGLGVQRLELQGRLAVEAPEIFAALSGLPRLTWVDIPNGDLRDVELCANSPIARRLERFTLSVLRKWTLMATPLESVTVSLALLEREHFGQLAAAIRAAVGFGSRGLRIASRTELDAGERQFLQNAAAAYERVEWV